MQTYYMNLPTQEPPAHIKTAIQQVRAWLRQVEAEERKVAEERRKRINQLQSMSAPRDWRDEL
jgi:ABC-type hemin transport system substrate-binding protein